jgi:uncharacterized membrane protein YhaH (DUF805 family)
VSIRENVQCGLKQYINFAGRSSRSQYRDFRFFAYFPLFSFGLVMYLENAELLEIHGALQPLVGWFFLLWWIALIPPAMAATVRRFHDLNMTGWWTIVPNGLVFWSALSLWGYAWVATPEGLVQARLTGAGYLIVILALMFMPGTTEENRYGLSTSAGLEAQVTIRENILCCLRQYIGFSGRSSRSEYRDFKIFALFPLFSLCLLIYLVETPGMLEMHGSFKPIVGWFFLLWWIALIPPSTAATVRRFHDLNMRGWWSILPNGLAFGLAAWAAFSLFSSVSVASPDAINSARLAGAGYLVVVVVLMFKTGTMEENRFGPNTAMRNETQPKTDRLAEV